MRENYAWDSASRWERTMVSCRQLKIPSNTENLPAWSWAALSKLFGVGRLVLPYADSGKSIVCCEVDPSKSCCQESGRLYNPAVIRVICSWFGRHILVLQSPPFSSIRKESAANILVRIFRSCNIGVNILSVVSQHDRGSHRDLIFKSLTGFPPSLLERIKCPQRFPPSPWTHQMPSKNAFTLLSGKVLMKSPDSRPWVQTDASLVRPIPAEGGLFSFGQVRWNFRFGPSLLLAFQFPSACMPRVCR